MNNKKVSIIVPVYNAEKYLKKCLDSIISQKYNNIEIICVDDGSTDNSLKILNEYYNEKPDVFKIKSISNSGQAFARNVGVSLSTGQYVMFVDSDDYILEDMIFDMIEKADKEVDIVCCDIDRIFEGKFSDFVKGINYDTKIISNRIVDIFNNPELICYLTAAVYAKLIKKEFLFDNNITFEEGYIYEDLLFTQQMLSCNPKIVLVNNKYYKYIVRENTTMTSKKSKVEDMFYIYNKIYSYYKKNGIETTFKKELDFLCYYHVLVGTSYRLWKSKKNSLLKSIILCKKFVKKYNCSKNNPYLIKKGFFIKMFVFIFG